MKKRILLLVSVFALIPNLYGQNSSIIGKVLYEKSLSPVDSIQIDLLDSTELVLKTVYSNKLGQFKFNDIPSGSYSLLTPQIEYFSYQVTNIQLSECDTFEYDIPIREPCPDANTTGICPFCNSTKKVLKISPGTVVSFNFGDNESAIRKYDRKLKRSKYRTYIRKGEEIVISMSIKSEREKFYSFCYNWFCKRCKKVF